MGRERHFLQWYSHWERGAYYRKQLDEMGWFTDTESMRQKGGCTGKGGKLVKRDGGQRGQWWWMWSKNTVHTLGKVNRTHHWACVSAEKSVSKDSYWGPLSDIFFHIQRRGNKRCTRIVIDRINLMNLCRCISSAVFICLIPRQTPADTWLLSCWFQELKSQLGFIFLFKCRCDLPPEGERIIFWMKY